MATVNYANPRPCAGGGHVAIDVSFNGGASQTVVYTTDELRQSLASLSQDQREELALLILKVHFAGKTRAQIQSELVAPGGVTVTI